MKHNILLIFIISVMFAACDDGTMPTLDEPLPLIIEGWIEDGEAPMVFVTHAVDLTGETMSFDDFVEKWCRVSVYDGDRRYLLTGRVNHDYTPPFVFTSSSLRGQKGHTYTLVVETEDTIAKAVSTIPVDAPKIISLEAMPVANSDTLFTINARFDNILTDSYYKVFARARSDEKRFYGSFLGTFRGDEYDLANGFVISRGVHSAFDTDDGDFTHFYPAKETVNVKICAMQKPLYDFWRCYDANVSLSQNLFFTFTENLPGNITGARGYWAAYASYPRTIHL